MLRSHTHCQVAQESRHTNQNLSKSMPAQTHRKNADPDKTKISASVKRKCLKMNKGQLVTRYIKHLADSADFKGGTFNKHCNGLTGNRLEMPNVYIPIC